MLSSQCWDVTWDISGPDHKCPTTLCPSAPPYSWELVNTKNNCLTCAIFPVDSNDLTWPKQFRGNRPISPSSLVNNTEADTARLVVTRGGGGGSQPDSARAVGDFLRSSSEPVSEQVHRRTDAVRQMLNDEDHKRKCIIKAQRCPHKQDCFTKHWKK